MKKVTLTLAGALLSSFLIYAASSDTLQARIYLDQAIQLQKKYKPERALALLKKSLVIYTDALGVYAEEVSDVYYNIGNCYLDLADYDKSLQYLQKSLDIRLNLPDPSSIKTGDVYTLMGLYYDYQAMYDKALILYDKAFAIYQNRLPPDDPRIGSVYNNMGICIYFKGDIKRAYLYFEKAFSITIDQYSNDYYRVAEELNNIGICLSEMKKYSAAAKCFQLAMQAAANNKSLYSIQGARLFHSSGINFFQSEQYEKALDYLNEALNIRLKEVGPDHPEVATNFYAMGLCHLELNQLEKAMAYFNQALVINVEKFGNDHPETGMCYEQKAKVYSSKGQLNHALMNIELALSAFQYNEQSVFESDILPDKQFIEVLATKAKIHQMLFGKTSDMEHLIISDHIYEVLIKLINKFRISYKEDRSKELLADEFYHIYDEAIEVSYALYEMTGESHFLHLAFNRSENSSSLVLLEAFRNSRARSFAGIPNTLLKKEHQLKSDITYYEKQKHIEEIKEMNEKDELKITKTKNRLFDFKQKYYDLIRLFETKYPQYFKLKYDLNTVSIKEIQEHILDPDQALVEYFLGEKSVFVFIITKNSFKVKKINKDFPLEEWVATLRSRTTRFQFPFNLPDNYHSELVNIANQLYNHLINPIKEELPHRIIIIPGDILALIPFEVFISNINGKAHQYKNHDYLLNDFSIGYCYSATLLKEMVDKRASKTTKNLIAVAPIFNNDIKPLTLRSTNLASLKYNIHEAKEIANLFGGETLLGENATEEKFAGLAHKYHMIHLATHGKADDETGEYSHLVFTEIIDTIENEWLFVKDIYNIELNAAMVTLSACETGIGEIRKGEGVISLARSFSYAGAACINTTLWKVNDAKTTNLMVYFYENIKSGQSKDEALRQAKLDFIKTYDHMEVHPFYWSSFITIGDMNSINPAHFTSSFKWIRILAGLLAMMLFITLFTFPGGKIRFV